MASQSSSRRILEEGCEIAEQRAVVRARENVVAFIRYVMRDEETGAPIELEDFQAEWHDFADLYPNLILWTFMEAGKTFSMSIARTLWELGRDPSLRFAIVSGNVPKAAKIGATIADYIQKSKELHQVFPKLVPDETRGWNTTSMTVKRTTFAKDPSIQIVGTGSDIQGSRLDRIVLDDVLNRENTRTDYMRKDTLDWYLKTFPGRMTARARQIAIGNALHPDDLLHVLAKNPEWRAFKYPILKPSGLPMWPGKWPIERVEQRRRILGPMESMSQLMCEAVDDAMARFKREYTDVCLGRGEGKDVVYALRAIPYGCRVYCGVDLGIKKKEHNAKTVFFVILVHATGDREVLWVEGDRWTAPQIMAKVVEYSMRFQCIFVVENNAGQDFLVQMLHASTAIPIVPFTTGNNKADATFGVEAMATEMAAGKWIIPNRGKVCHPAVQEWLDQMHGYSPLAHTGDHLMASWLGKEGERLGKPTKPVPETGVVRLRLSNW